LVLLYHYQSDRIIIAIPYHLSRDLFVMVKKNQQKETDDMADLISQAEAARLRGVTRAAIQDLVRRGRIRSVNVGGRSLVYRSEITNYQQGEAGRPKKAE
jgi:excisionase family DNA binding protein